MYVTLSLAKQHLNIESGYTEEDAYITQLIKASEDAVKVHINDDLEEIAEGNGGTLPESITQCILLMIGHLYQNREIVGSKTQELPNSFHYLINLYRNYSN